jgi:hypothetical protein
VQDVGHGEEPEIKRVASRSVSPSGDEHKSGALPTISTNKEQRRKADRRDHDHDKQATLSSFGGGGRNAVVADGGSEVEDIEGADTTVLPPIGGIKAKRDNKQTSKTRLTVRNAGITGGSGSVGAALGGGAPGNSKGFGSTGHHALVSTGLSSMSSTGAVSSNQFWGGGVKEPENTRHAAAAHAAAAAAGPPTPPGGADAGAVHEKMSSTWHVSQHTSKYVSPFPPKGSKKR